MKATQVLSAFGLVVLGMVLMAATSSKGEVRESRPRIVQEGAVVISVDRNSGVQNPLRYLVVDVDGPWLQVNLLKKKSKKNKKGDPFWLHIETIGAFVVE